MKKTYVFGVSVLLASSLANAEKTASVELTAAFYATSERTIEQGNGDSAFVYSVLGASRLVSDSGAWKFSNECLGFDEIGSEQGTKGIGRCIWRDTEDHKLFLEVKTVGENNIYDITGGTGKWSGATGSIKSSFTYLPAPGEIYLGFDEGSGTISTPKSE